MTSTRSLSFLQPKQEVHSYGFLEENERKYNKILFLTCPTGAFCREDRCQSFFEAHLIPTMRPPLEECEAGGAISNSGADFLVLDSPALNLADEIIFDKIFQFSPDLIVLSVTFGSLQADLKWSQRLKDKFPLVPIGLRGAPCYVRSKELLLENQSIDFCLHGDYEVILRSIIENGLSNAAGVTFRNSNSTISSTGTPLVEDLDQLPLPDRSKIDSSLYRVRGFGEPQATIRVQRGCPFPCTYCLVHTVSGKRARHRSSQSIITEMKALINSGIRFFYLRAETFTLDKKWVLELLSEMKNHCPEARWVTTTRVEHVDDEVLRAMKAAGCYGISFGLDVASEIISQHVKKPIRKNEAIQAIKLCRKHGIISLAYIMIGFIWETRATLNEAAQFVKDVCPDLLTINFAHPYPGTVYYEQVKESRLSHKIVSLKAQAEPALELDELRVEEVKKFGKKLLKNHYLQFKVLTSLGVSIAKIGMTIFFENIFFKNKRHSFKLK